MPESMMQPDLQNVAPVNGVRAAALARWQERGWPGVKDEAWRFTRLAALDKLSLRPADPALQMASRLCRRYVAGWCACDPFS